MQTFIEGIDVARKYQLQNPEMIKPNEHDKISFGCEREESCVNSQQHLTVFFSDTKTIVRTINVIRLPMPSSCARGVQGMPSHSFFENASAVSSCMMTSRSFANKRSRSCLSSSMICLFRFYCYPRGARVSLSS